MIDEEKLNIRITMAALKPKPLVWPAELGQLDWLFASDHKLEELFDRVVKTYPHTAASAKLASIWAKQLREI